MHASSTVQSNANFEQGANPALLAALASPESYPGHPPVAVHETHASWVFVAGDRAYKVKKPVSLGFLDYSTLVSRHDACCEEVRVNDELAPGIYLGVLAVVPDPDGISLRFCDRPERGRVRGGDAQLQRGRHARRPDRGRRSHTGAHTSRGPPAGRVSPPRGRGHRLGSGSRARRVAAEHAGVAASVAARGWQLGIAERFAEAFVEAHAAEFARARAAGACPRWSWGSALRARADEAHHSCGGPHRVRP